MQEETKNKINSLSIPDLHTLKRTLVGNLSYQPTHSNYPGYKSMVIYLPLDVLILEINELSEVITLVDSRLEDEAIREEIRGVLNE